ncbi:unnamed protein product [Lasius platythorax]|uniref:Uncharacterized protein n=1 Tax=Lasius platythorax TaxID=488582 RepID=A0AAV2NAK1_9HYME
MKKLDDAVQSFASESATGGERPGVLRVTRKQHDRRFVTKRTGKARQKGPECPLTTNVGGFERAAITREGKRAGGYPLLAERFNGGFARAGLMIARARKVPRDGVDGGGAHWVARRRSGALGRK